jgi:TolB-like protein/Flp pilus assembly protein TadD
MALHPGDRLGPLEVLNPLGAGGMGEVYRARDSRLGREVAVKVLPEHVAGSAERVARLEQEARALASLSDPNIAAVFGLEEHGGRKCLVMELVPGATLAERLERGPLPLREALDVGRQVAQALEAAHAVGVIHRDLKPSNVKVTPEGRVKLLDFGLAKSTQVEAPDSMSPTASPLTREGDFLGTAAYMSPEQARSQAIDKRSDVWSFGCLLYELLTGRMAFGAETLSDTLVAVLEREPDWSALPAKTPAPVRSLLQRCLQKDTSHRLHDIADARIELVEALAASTSARGSAAAPGLSRRWRRLVAPAAAALLVALALAAALRIRSRTTGEPAGTRAPVRLAVLPFNVMTGSAGAGDLGLGLADDIITHLANYGQLQIRPTQAVLRYLGQPPEPQEAGRALKVDQLLIGTIRSRPGGLRITTQLVRVDDGVPFWGESFDLDTGELPGIEDRISAQVAAALALPIADAAAKARHEKRYTEKADAYEAYLRGRASMVYGSEKGTQAAIAEFEEALRLDPGYALAHAGLSMASAQMHLRFANAADAPAWRERALREAERAQALDADLAETHQALADVYGKTDFEWERVILESSRALELNPRLTLPHAFIGRAFYHLGLVERAEQKARIALALEPENAEALRTLGIALLLSGRYREAVPPLEEIQRLSGKPLSDSNLALAYYYGGDKARAEATLVQLSDSTAASASQRARAWLAAFLAARGERARASDLVGELSAGPFMDHHVANGLGNAYAQLGRPDEALRWLRQAADSGFPCLRWYDRDPLLAPIRETPEFAAWLGELRVRLREAEQRFGRY